MQAMVKLVAISNSPQADAFVNDGISEKGYTIEVMHDPEVAIRHVHNAGADLVLLDARFDVEKTIEWLKRLRRQWSADVLPVLVVTRTADCDPIVRMLQAGANDFILRPEDVDLVDRRVRSALSVRDKLARLLEEERRLAVSETLTQASAAIALAISPIIDGLEQLMSDSGKGKPVTTKDLEILLEPTETTVCLIDRMQQIAMLEEVSSRARMHLLKELSALQC